MNSLEDKDYKEPNWRFSCKTSSKELCKSYIFQLKTFLSKFFELNIFIKREYFTGVFYTYNE